MLHNKKPALIKDCVLIRIVNSSEIKLSLVKPRKVNGVKSRDVK